MLGIHVAITKLAVNSANIPCIMCMLETVLNIAIACLAIMCINPDPFVPKICECHHCVKEIESWWVIE